MQLKGEGTLGENGHGDLLLHGIVHSPPRQRMGLIQHRVGGEGEENTRLTAIVKMTLQLALEDNHRVCLGRNIAVFLRTVLFLGETVLQNGVIHAQHGSRETPAVVAVGTLEGAAAIEIAAHRPVFTGGSLGGI